MRAKITYFLESIDIEKKSWISPQFFFQSFLLLIYEVHPKI